MISGRDEEIVDKIAMLRARNNLLWMRLLEIALEHAPDQTKTLLKSINSNDRSISDLLKDLTQ